MGELIPILGVSIPLVVVIGKFVIQPVLEAITKATQRPRVDENVAPIARRLAETEERLERMEQSLTRLLEEQEFRRELGMPQSATRPTIDRT
jgi:hypothetical protein